MSNYAEIQAQAPQHEPERQYYFIEVCRQKVQEESKRLGRPLTFCVTTFGLSLIHIYHFCLNTEVYTDFLDVVVNAKLRNAIGHNDVECDAVSQVITYIPNPKDRTIKKTEYLLEFENEAMHMFQALLGVSEYLYRLRELSLMYDGKIPLMVQERANWPKKIGRNDPCPCGSGKKYKFCHGKN